MQLLPCHCTYSCRTLSLAVCVLQLPLGTLVFMLNRFQPDDFSREGIPYDVLAALRRDAAAAGFGDSNLPPKLEVEAECTYYSPTDDMAMEKVRTGEGGGGAGDASLAMPVYPTRWREQKRAQSYFGACSAAPPLQHLSVLSLVLLPSSIQTQRC